MAEPPYARGCLLNTLKNLPVFRRVLRFFQKIEPMENGLSWDWSHNVTMVFFML